MAGYKSIKKCLCNGCNLHFAFMQIFSICILKLSLTSKVILSGTTSCEFSINSKIVYKKTDKWYIEWQRVTTNDNEWQRVVQRVTTSDTTSDNEWQRVTTSGITSDNEWQLLTTSDNQWQRTTTNGNEWQRVREVIQWIKTAQYTSKNGWLPSFQWKKKIHYYFQEWMAKIVINK